MYEEIMLSFFQQLIDILYLWHHAGKSADTLLKFLLAKIPRDQITDALRSDAMNG
jgi:hypothetical protein